MTYKTSQWTWEKSVKHFDEARKIYENEATAENRKMSRNEAHREFLKRLGEYVGGEFLFNDEPRAR